MVEIRVRFPEHYIYLLFPCVLFDMFLFEGWRDQNVIVLVAPGWNVRAYEGVQWQLSYSGKGWSFCRGM